MHKNKLTLVKALILTATVVLSFTSCDEYLYRTHFSEVTPDAFLKMRLILPPIPLMLTIFPHMQDLMSAHLEMTTIPTIRLPSMRAIFGFLENTACRSQEAHGTLDESVP